MVREGLLEVVTCVLGPVKAGAGRGGFQAEGMVLGTLCMFEDWKPVWPRCGGGAGERNGVSLAGLAGRGEVYGFLWRVMEDCRSARHTVGAWLN